MSRRARWFLVSAVGVLIVAAALIGGAWWMLREHGSALTRERIEAALAAATGRPARVERAVVRPWLGSLVLEGVALAAGDTWDAGTLLRIGRVEARLGISSVWHRELVLARLRLEDLALRLAGGGGGGRVPLPGTIPDHVTLGPVSVAIGTISVAGASVDYRDAAAGRRIVLEGLSADARPADGGLDASLEAARLRVVLAGHDETVESLGASLQLRGDRVRVRRARGRWLGATLAVRGEIARLSGDPDLALDVDATAPLGPLAARAGPAWRVDGTLRAQGTVRGPARAPAVTAAAAIPSLAVGPVRARRVSARVEWGDGRLRLEDVRADTLGGSVGGALVLSPARLEDTRVSARLTGVSIAELQMLAGRALGLRGRATLQAEARGDPRHLAGARGWVRVESATLQLSGPAASLGEATLSGEARFAGTVLDIGRAAARTRAGRVELSGRVGPEGPITLHVAADVDLHGLGALWGGGIEGKASLTGEARGRWAAPVFTGQARAAMLTVRGVRVEDVVAPLELRGRTLRLSRAAASLGESRVEVTGDVTWTGPTLSAEQWRRSLRFSADVRAPDARAEDVNRWLPDGWAGHGRFSIAARLHGTPAAWRAVGTLDSAALTVRRRIDHLRARFAVDPAALEISRLEARVAGVPVAGSGRWSWGGTVRGEADVGPAALSAIPGVPPAAALDGTARARVTLVRVDSGLSLVATLAVQGASAGRIALGDGEGRVTLQGDALSAEVAFPQARLTASARGRLAPGATLAVRAHVETLALAPLVARAAPRVSGRARGAVTATANIALPLDDPMAASGEVVLDPVHLELAGEPWEGRGPIVVRRTPGTTRIERLELASAVGTVTGGGEIHDTGRLDLRLRGRFPLALLATFRPEVREADGFVEASATVGGTLAAPEPAGEATIANASVTLRDYPDALRGVRARLTASLGTVRLVSASASLGGGELRAAGEASLEHGLGAFRVAVTARRVTLPPLEGFETAWDADLELLGLGERAQLRGEARLRRGTYARDISLLRMLLQRRAAAAAPAAGGLHLDLRVALDDNLVARTSLIRFRAGGILTVQGTTSAPILFGTVTARDGTLIFRRQRFTLTAASARFADPGRIDPIVDVRGVARIRTYDVTLEVSGRSEDLQIRLTSSPPLPEDDVLTLVAFGATREQLGRSGPGLVVGEVAGLLIQDLFGVGPEQSPVDVLEMETTESGGQELRVGKRLTPRTLVVYSQGIEDVEETKLRVEYQVFGPLVVAGEQDFRGGFGADVLVRLRFR